MLGLGKGNNFWITYGVDCTRSKPHCFTWNIFYQSAVPY